MFPAADPAFGHRRCWSAGLLVLTVLLGGCAIGGGDKVDDQRATLRQRPDIEAISARYERMLTELRDRFSAEIGGLTWVQDDNGARRGCGFEFPDVPEGQSRSLRRWSVPGGLSDDRWEQAVAIVREITGKYGFGTPEVIVSRPGNHELVVPDRYGGTLIFGTAANLILRMRTGCHLPPQ